MSGTFAAIGTVGAFATGGVLLIRERRRDEQREVEQRRMQASLVSAFTDPQSAVAETYVPVQVLVQNGSSSPVYDVCLVFPDSTAPAGAVNYAVGLIPGGETLAAPIAGDQQSYLGPTAIEVFLTDQTGRRWQRDDNGRLTEVPEDEVTAVPGNPRRRLRRGRSRRGPT